MPSSPLRSPPSRKRRPPPASTSPIHCFPLKKPFSSPSSLDQLLVPLSPSSSSSSSSSSCCISGHASLTTRLSATAAESAFKMFDLEEYGGASSECEDSSAGSSCSTSALSSVGRSRRGGSPDVALVASHRSSQEAVVFVEENRGAERYLHGKESESADIRMAMAFDPDTVFRFLDGADSKAEYEALASCCSLDNASWFLHDFDSEIGGDFVNEWMAEAAANHDHLDDTLDSASCVFHL